MCKILTVLQIGITRIFLWFYCAKKEEMKLNNSECFKQNCFPQTNNYFKKKKDSDGGNIEI